MDELLKLAQKMFDIVDRSNRNICATLPPYNVDKANKTKPQVRNLAWEKSEGI